VEQGCRYFSTGVPAGFSCRNLSSNTGVSPDETNHPGIFGNYAGDTIVNRAGENFKEIPAGKLAQQGRSIE